MDCPNPICPKITHHHNLTRMVSTTTLSNGHLPYWCTIYELLPLPFQHCLPLRRRKLYDPRRYNPHQYFHMGRIVHHQDTPNLLRDGALDTQTNDNGEIRHILAFRKLKAVINHFLYNVIKSNQLLTHISHRCNQPWRYHRINQVTESETTIY